MQSDVRGLWPITFRTEPSFLSTITARMVSFLRKLRSCLLCGCGKPGDGYEPLDQDASDSTPIVEELEPELVQERAKCARVEKERDELAEAKGKLEKEIQRLNIKVSQVGRGTGLATDGFC
jgi:hypothetical protein